jgi:hypothetical protein
MRWEGVGVSLRRGKGMLARDEHCEGRCDQCPEKKEGTEIKTRGRIME